MIREIHLWPGLKIEVFNQRKQQIILGGQIKEPPPDSHAIKSYEALKIAPRGSLGRCYSK